MDMPSCLEEERNRVHHMCDGAVHLCLKRLEESPTTTGETQWILGLQRGGNHSNSTRNVDSYPYVHKTTGKPYRSPTREDRLANVQTDQSSSRQADERGSSQSKQRTKGVKGSKGAENTERRTASKRRWTCVPGTHRFSSRAASRQTPSILRCPRCLSEWLLLEPPQHPQAGGSRWLNTAPPPHPAAAQPDTDTGLTGNGTGGCDRRL
ncbi:hypothetical protein NDU88_000695 [Pleurodeles waltl]|uniref:Uncharacterized protein n=1 Tax=Pleurodeles waltl TaxID=8319 RepID=A0AAV7MIE1_PLEWA|nr:hypothetical protein NDU88_000695 [Pleurodeles waltl]